MATSSNSIFTGSSPYAQDFQGVITRAVGIASLPITQLNNDLNTLNDQYSAMSGLDQKFAALQSSVSKIADAAGGASFQTDISDPSLVSAAVGDGAMEGYYSIEVRDAGVYSSSMTAKSWVAPVNPPGTKHTYQLYVGTDEYDITPDDNTATSVATAINAAAGGVVSATAANVGSTDSPDWRITLRSTALDDVMLQIRDAGVDLQDQDTLGVHGHEASYVVNNSGNVIQSKTRTVNIANGLSVTLLKASPGQAAGITLTRSTAALSDALSDFTSAYNATLAALDAQRGSNNGALSGESLLYQLTNQLRALGTYSSAGPIGGLAGLGLSLQDDGTLTFNQFTLMSANLTNSAGVAGFLGSPSTTGFLKVATDVLQSLEDPDSGLIKAEEANTKSRISDVNQQIADKQAQVNELQQRLTEQMAAADAMISSMTQQYTYLSNMFQAMQTAADQYK